MKTRIRGSLVIVMHMWNLQHIALCYVAISMEIVYTIIHCLGYNNEILSMEKHLRCCKLSLYGVGFQRSETGLVNMRLGLVQLTAKCIVIVRSYSK